MEGVRNAEQMAKSWWQFFDYCFNYDPSALICQSFWAKVIWGFIILGCIGVLYGLWVFWDYRRKWQQARIAQWQRESVDEAGIKEIQWIADKAYQAEVPDDELLARIKAAVDARKLEVGSGSRPDAPA